MKFHIAILGAAILVASTAVAQTTGISVKDAGLKPAKPAVGNNTLDILVADGAGKPVLGLKLTSSVAMTSMDMGTTHPAVKETGKGHYRITAAFTMAGPWRIRLTSPDPKFEASFDFEAGSGVVWKMPKKAETDMPMDGMDHEAMQSHPLKESAVVTVKGDEDWSVATGFGNSEGMVAMMNLMMVAGSGMEGMKMAPMQLDFGESNFLPAAVAPDPAPASLKLDAKLASPATAGDNKLELTITGPDGKPVVGAKVTLAVEMTSMAMGTSHPLVTELGKGKYIAKLSYSMVGPWRVTVRAEAAGYPPVKASLNFVVK